MCASYLDTVPSACNPRETGDAFRRAGSDEARQYNIRRYNTRPVSPVYHRTAQRLDANQTENDDANRVASTRVNQIDHIIYYIFIYYQFGDHGPWSTY